MISMKGFWSYVHRDDQADSERITRLARDVVNQFEMLTGDTISLFLDKDDIEWGNNWRDRIDESLSNVAFFIPIITPRYFLSPQCRRELQFFARRATELGVKDLILPLLYVDYLPIHDENTEDELVILIRTFQYINWCDIRFKDVTSEEYRRGVSNLANRLVEANKHADSSSVTTLIQSEESSLEETDDTPGIIEQLASAEDTLSKLPETLNAITDNISRISDILTQGTVEIDQSKSHTRGFGARLSILNRTASLLREPTENIWILSNEYSSQLHTVDTGIRIIISKAPSEIQDDPSTKENYRIFFSSIRDLFDSANNAINNTKAMIESSEELEKLSRDLRPVIRKQNRGLTILNESVEVFKEWIHLIEGLGINWQDTN